MNKYREGYYWVLYKDFGIPYVVELRLQKMDHTDDYTGWVIYEGDHILHEEDFFKYRFISYIEEPEYPYGEVDIKIT